MKPVILASVTLVSVQLAGCESRQSDEPKRPNILFAISDDQSFGHTWENFKKLIKLLKKQRIE